jgi:hypothetical protein
VLCPDAFSSGSMGCIDPGGCDHDTPCSSCGFHTIWSKGLRPKIIDDAGELQQDVNPVWLTEIKWSRYKTETDSEGKTTLRAERQGTVIEFLDEFELVFQKYAYHRYILERTRASNVEFDRNALPGMLKLDVDWAENFTMLHAREIQSEYWLLKQISLFIGIGKLLSEAAWEATTGTLEVGAEVTITSVQCGMFWAEVVAAGGSEERAQYTVRDAAGTLHQFIRCELRARVWYTMAQTGVTNDKKHDSYSTQHFMNVFIDEWLDEHSATADDDPLASAIRHITSLHIHSDNAGSHFKNSKTLNFLSRLFERLGFKVTWSFGCPGHGKGPWDGFGGLMKRVMRRDTIDENVVLLDYVQAAAHLRTRFCTELWQQKHGLDSKYTINKVSVIEAHSLDIDRRDYEVFAPAVGIRKSFGYMALSTERVLQRWFDCWCPRCILADGPGRGSMNSNYQVTGCRAQEPWWEHSVALQGTRGVGARRKEAQRRGRELAGKLKPGMFIAVEDRGIIGPDVPFWIGVTQDAGNGTCIAKHHNERQTVGSTRFDPGDYAIAVKWYLPLLNS